MRIAVLGNCQSKGFSDALRANLADAQIDDYEIGPLVKAGKTGVVADSLPSYDVVFSQQGSSEHVENLCSAHLQRTIRHLQFYPSILFTGFHPDFLYISDRDGSHVQCPTAAYHSRLVAACYSLDLSPGRAALLFNAYIYRLLGYFDAFATSVAFIVKTGADVGFDLSREIDAWIGDDGFMHTINHPKQRVLDTVMHFAAAKAELRLDGPALPSPDDHLERSVVLPVYPEIAQHLNVRGSMDFKCLVHTDDGIRFPVVLPLGAYIEETYRTYRDAQISPSDLSPSVAAAASVISRAMLPAARGEVELKHERRNSIKRDISNLYRTILFREPDQKGLDLYLSHIEDGSVTLSDLVRLALQSMEFKLKTDAFIAAYMPERLSRSE
jgi:hypothetical protein